MSRLRFLWLVPYDLVQRVFTNPLRPLVSYVYGYDFFISHAWSDAEGYARQLRAALGKHKPKSYECFVDKFDYDPSEPLDEGIKRSLRRSSFLILLVTKKAVEGGQLRPRIHEEVQHFGKRPVICVKLDDVALPEIVANRDLIEEQQAHPLADGPSPHVIEQLATKFRLPRRATLRSHLFAVAALVFLLLSITATVFFVRADRARVAELDAKDELRGRLAWNYLDRAIADLEAGEYDEGLSRLWKAYDTTETGDPLRTSLLRLLGTWDASVPIACRFPGSRLHGVEFGHDGKTLLTSHEGGPDRQYHQYIVQRWNTDSGRPVGTPIEPSGSTTCMALSADSTLVVTAGYAPLNGILKTTVDIWDTINGERVGSLPIEHVSVDIASFSVDGKLLLTAGQRTPVDYSVQLWQTKSQRKWGMPLVHDKKVLASAFSPDASRIATGCQAGLTRLWDAESSQMIAELPRDEEDDDNSPIVSVAFSPDGLQILSATRRGTVNVWDLQTLRRIDLGGLESFGTILYDAQFGRRGVTVLSKDSFFDDFTRLYDARTHQRPIGPGIWREVQELWPDDIVPIPVALSSDGGKAAMRAAATRVEPTRRVEQYTQNSRAWIWRTQRGRPIGELPDHSDDITFVVPSLDGSEVLAGSLDEVRRYSARTGEASPAPEQIGSILATTSDGVFAFAGDTSDDSRFRIVNTRTLRSHGKVLQSDDWIVSAAFHPADQFRVLTVSENGDARIWNLETGEKLSKVWDDTSVHSVEFSPDGTAILGVDTSGRARLWNAQTGTVEQTLNSTSTIIKAATFSPDGSRVLTGSEDGEAQIWISKTGTRLGDALRHEGEVVAVAFAPDGKVAATGTTKWALRFWDVETRAPLGPPLRHEKKGMVVAIAFTQDGRNLWSATANANVWTWEVPQPFSVKSPAEEEQLSRWIQLRTGLHWDEDGLSKLDHATWRERWPELDELGGAPHRIK